jgi:hypothetical protein
LTKNKSSDNAYHNDITSGQIYFNTDYTYTLLTSYGFNNQEIKFFDNSWATGVAFVLLNNFAIKSMSFLQLIQNSFKTNF